MAGFLMRPDPDPEAGTSGDDRPAEQDRPFGHDRSALYDRPSLYDRPLPDDCPFRRVLVPIESTPATTSALSLGVRLGRNEGVSLRVVHVRVWDPVPRGIGRVYTETSEAATRVVDTAMTDVWERGALDASAVVLEARRTNLHAAILAEATDWGADLVVLAFRPRRFQLLGAYEKAFRKIMRASACPVLIVCPGR